MRALTLTVLALLLTTPGPLAASPDATESTIRPGDDFYGYANARWLAEQECTGLPDNAGTTAVLIETNMDRVRALIDDFLRRPTSADERKAGDFHASLMDGPRIERLGLAPLRHDLAAIGRIRDRRGLAAWIGAHLSLDDGSGQRVDGPLGIWVHQGFHDADHYAVHVIQGGLGLSAPAAYSDASPAGVEQRNVYAARVARVLAEAGIANPAARAQGVLTLEARIAATHASGEDSADPAKIDNSWSRGDFAGRAPGMDWAALWGAAGLAPNDRYVVWQPDMLRGLSQLVAKEPLERWRDYLMARTVAHYADALSQKFSDGTQGDRAALAIRRTREAMPDTVGKAYAARHFPPAAKLSAETMVGFIRTAFAARIGRAEWMADETRVKALTKLKDLRIGLGYPDKWTDYSALQVQRGDPLGNIRRAEQLAYRRAVARLGTPVDPGEWAIAPETVGAVLTLSPNAMQFSAGILQPPYFDPLGDAASNFGSAGAGLAHEVSHSFDPVGNTYDEAGRLGLWWQEDDRARYNFAGAPLAAQLGRICPFPGACVRSERVLNESLADLVGLQVAYDAYRLSLDGQADRVIDGLTGDQRFFIAFARRWRRKQPETALRRYIESDGHLPPQARAATVRNLDAWHEAFGVKPGDRLYLAPQDRVRPWGK